MSNWYPTSLEWMFEMNSFLNCCCDQQLRAIYGALENTMKYSLGSITIKSSEVNLELNDIEVEYSLEELKQFAENSALIVNTLVSAFEKLAPTIEGIAVRNDLRRVERDKARNAHEVFMEEMREKQENARDERRFDHEANMSK